MPDSNQPDSILVQGFVFELYHDSISSVDYDCNNLLLPFLDANGTYHAHWFHVCVQLEDVEERVPRLPSLCVLASAFCFVAWAPVAPATRKPGCLFCGTRFTFLARMYLLAALYLARSDLLNPAGINISFSKKKAGRNTCFVVTTSLK